MELAIIQEVFQEKVERSWGAPDSGAPGPHFINNVSMYTWLPLMLAKSGGEKNYKTFHLP